MTQHSDDSSGRRPRIHARADAPQSQAPDRGDRRGFKADRSSGRDGERPRGRSEFTPVSRGPRHGIRYRVDLEYLGTRYSGWQFQTNARTVAGEIMEAIHRATGQRVVEVYGSGRTDAGVHALHQVAHIDLAKDIDPRELLVKVNDELPGDINFLKVEKAPEGFHARHSATARTYLYRISRRRSAFDKPVVWWVKDDLDVEAMAQASRALTGLHDFAAFAQSDPSRPDESTKVKVEGVEVFEDGPNIFIRIQGSHFLWKMVRRIVGVLVEVGRGRLRAGDIARIMAADGASVAEFTAPPSGLSLENVSYAVSSSVASASSPRPQEGRREERAERPVREKVEGSRPPAREKSEAPRRVVEARPDGHRGETATRDARHHETPQRFAASKPKTGFRPKVERTEAGGGPREGGWPRRSASREFPPARDKQTFRRRG
jgi:tRNA pseudouridine38-40 synthase